MVASTPRTGSTLLCRALWDLGTVGAPKEYLNPMQRRDWALRTGGLAKQAVATGVQGPLLSLMRLRRWTTPRLTAHLEAVRARRSGLRWFGLKLHWHHLQELPTDLEAVVGPIRWIRITRPDRLDQAISWVRATQSGRWASSQRGWGTPELYSRRAIDARLADIDAAERGWDQALAGQSVLSLTYDQVATDLAGSCQAVLQHLGEPTHGAMPEPALARQADGRSASWKARYQAGD